MRILHHLTMLASIASVACIGILPVYAQQVTPIPAPPESSHSRSPPRNLLAHKVPPDWLWADDALRNKWRAIVEPSVEQSARAASLTRWFERVIAEVPAKPKSAKARFQAKEKMCEAYLAAHLIGAAVREQDNSLGKLFGLAIKHGAELPPNDANGLGHELMLYTQYMQSNHAMYEGIKAKLDPKLADECNRQIHSQTKEQLRQRLPPDLQWMAI